MDQFSPHEVTWTRAKSSRFWDVLAARLSDHSYFSATAGEALVGFARRHGADLAGRVLDFGCGPGHLVARLVETGGRVSAVDFSRRSIERVVERFGDHPSFEEARVIESVPTPLPDGRYDTIFFIETIEHLLDGDLEAAVTELHRLLRKGGTVVISTPNEEGLEDAKNVCPDCGCIFHPMQHVRSWSPSSLKAFMARFGFSGVAVQPVFFRNRWWKTLLAGTALRLLGKRLPHMVYIGRRD